MKKLFLLPILLLFCVAGYSQSNTIKLNLPSLGYGVVGLTYEKALGDKTSVELGIQVGAISASVDAESVSLSAIGGMVMYKFYLSQKESPRGVYVGPKVNYLSVSGKNTADEKGTANVFTAGVLFGSQWIFGKSDSGFVLDVGIGFSYFNLSLSENLSSDFTFDGIGPDGRLAIGYAF